MDPVTGTIAWLHQPSTTTPLRPEAGFMFIETKGSTLR